MTKNFKIIILSLSIIMFTGHARAQSLTDEAARLFERAKHAVFQVRVIDLATQEKSATGSGFFINNDGYVVTNYHVVSAYIDKPQNHKVQIIDHNQDDHALTLLYFDIVHDLAILQVSKPIGNYLNLAQTPLSKGEKIFSIGNPHDLGMTIIEGTFNGLMNQSLDQKILLTASLNPGMSGGPTINHDGEVIGINVATMGNDVSFLVPVAYLKNLLDILPVQSISPSNWDNIIEQQLLENQDQYINAYLNMDWASLELGGAFVPGAVKGYIKCWGTSKDEEEDLLQKARTDCAVDDYIYVNDEFYTAYLNYWFTWHSAKDLNHFRFYGHLQNDFYSTNYMNNAPKEEVFRFNCKTDFVNLGGRTLKSAICARKYKRFTKLYDMSLSVTTVDSFDESLMGGLILQGVTQENGMALMNKFLGQVQWKK